MLGTLETDFLCKAFDKDSHFIKLSDDESSHWGRMLQPHGVKVEARPEELTTVKLLSCGQEGSFLGIVKDAYL